MKYLILSLLAGCAVDPSQPRVLETGDELAITWSLGQDRSCEQCSPRWTVPCGTEIYHPCPLELYSTLLTVGVDRAVFAGMTGGADANGTTAETLGTIKFPLDLDDAGNLHITSASGGAGLRHDGILMRNGDSYSGDLEWSLYTEAGYTTFHVELNWL